MILTKVYQMMNAAKKRIIKAMQERGVKKVNLVMTWEEWAKKYGLDPSDDPGGDYYSYRYQEAPQVIFFNDNGVGRDFSVLSVKLVDDSFNPRFEIQCYNSEDGIVTFNDYELTYLSIISVYDALEEELEMEDKPQEWEFDEQAFIERYCPMEGGNDYLGWIEDICKLLDGEAEPGDCASTGDYAKLTERELKEELKRLKAIVLHQAVDRYVEQNY